MLSEAVVGWVGRVRKRPAVVFSMLLIVLLMVVEVTTHNIRNQQVFDLMVLRMTSSFFWYRAVAGVTKTHKRTIGDKGRAVR